MRRIKLNDLCTRVYVLKLDGDGFFLYFYGLTESDLMVCPNQYIVEAIVRRGLMPGEYTSSPFMVESVRPYKRNYVMESMIGRFR